MIPDLIKIFGELIHQAVILRIGRQGEQGAYFGGTTSLLNLPAGVKLKPSQTTLDHYEEGNWTVQIADASSGGTQASIGSNSTGSYVRIGRIVTIACPALSINPSGLNTSNSLFVRNFPFSISSTNTCVFTAPLICPPSLTSMFQKKAMS